MAVAAVIVFAASLAGTSHPGQRWMVAARSLGPGTVLESGDLMSVTMRLSSATAALAYREPVSVEGRTLAVGVRSGELLQESMLVPSSQQPVLRPVSLAVDPVSLAGLSAGQLVDVLMTQGTGNATGVTVVVRGATLLDVVTPSSGPACNRQRRAGHHRRFHPERGGGRCCRRPQRQRSLWSQPSRRTDRAPAREPPAHDRRVTDWRPALTGERYVLLGLAPARAPWFAAVAQWATSATIAAEFIKCVSADEVRARLSSGRRHSALLVDAASPSFDRDVVDAARAALTPVIAVRGPRSHGFAGRRPRHRRRTR